MNKVQSSNIAEVDYSAESQELFIKFTNGATYKYEEVPSRVYSDFLKAESKGKFFHSNIRNVYDYRRVE